MEDSGELQPTDADFFMAALWDAARPAALEVPGYEILGEISRGGMGAVHHARQLRPEREVALKVLLPQFAEEPEMLARFQLEARAMAALDHPGILPVYEVGEAEGMPFFSMKLADGGTLADRLKHGPLAPREAAPLMIQLARAVHHAHQHGVLHRDLKPGNFLFMEDGRACVSDFGLAKLSLPDQGPLTRTESFFGTPHYMPPEVAAGSVADSTVAGDLYSMGAVFYECLTGTRPHPARENVAALLRSIADDPVKPPHLVSPSVPRDLSVVCMKALEKKPADRYATLEEFAADIERWCEGRPIRARPVGPAEAAWRWAGRHPLSAGLLGTLAAVLVISGILLALTLRETRAQLHRALIEQARSERLLGNPGHRQRAMRLLEQAASIARSAEIRGEVAALVSRPDLLPQTRRTPAAAPPAEPLPEDPVLRWKAGPDGTSGLAWHESGTVRWWQQGKALAEFQPADNRDITASVHPSGTLAAFAGTSRGLVLARRGGGAASLTEIARPPQGMQDFLEIDPAATRVALAGPDGLWVARIDAPDRAWKLAGSPARCAPAWSGDGMRLAIAVGDRREALVLAAEDGQACATIPTSGIPEQLALDPAGTLLAVAASDGQLSIHDAADGFVFSSVPLRSMGLSFPSPARLRSLTDDGGFEELDLEPAFALFHPWKERPRAKSDGLVSRMALSPDGTRLLTISAGCAAIWSVAEQAQTGFIPLESQRVDDRASGWWLGNEAVLLQVPGGLERVAVDYEGRPGAVEPLARVPGSVVLEVDPRGDWLVQGIDEDGNPTRERWPGGDSNQSVADEGATAPAASGLELRGDRVITRDPAGRLLRLGIPNPIGIADACMTPDGSQVIALTKDHRVVSWSLETLGRTLDASGF